MSYFRMKKENFSEQRKLQPSLFWISVSNLSPPHVLEVK